MNIQSVQDEQRALLIEKGRMAVEALRSREQEAHFHAESLELSLAIRDAELGHAASLASWMERHGALVHESHRVKPQCDAPHFVTRDAPTSTEPARKIATEPTFTSDNLWANMLQGALHRRRQRALASERSHATPGSVDSTNRASSSELRKDIKEQLGAGSDVNDHPKLSSPREVVHEASNDLPKTVKLSSTDQTSVLAAPAWLKASQPSKKEEKNRWWRLSPSVLFSTLAHIIAVSGMSVVAIRMAKTHEPKAIVASTVDTHQVSMEAPVDFASLDAEELDVSEPVSPTLPTFSAEPAEATSVAVELPSSMVGLGSSINPSTASNAVEQAAQMGASQLMLANAAEFFGVKAAGNTFCYLVDCSPSMRSDNAFSAAKAELVRSLSLLKPKQRYFISFFARDIVDLTFDGGSPQRFPVYATPENLRSTLAWIEQVRVQDNGKAPNEALQRAIAMDPDGIFLLFDGDTTVDVPAFLRKNNRSTDLLSVGEPLVPIHTLGFYDVEHQALMQRIAQENNGTFRFIPNPMRKP